MPERVARWEARRPDLSVQGEGVYLNSRQDVRLSAPRRHDETRWWNYTGYTGPGPVYTGRVGVHRHVYIHTAGVTLWFRLIKLCLGSPKGRRVTRSTKEAVPARAARNAPARAFIRTSAATHPPRVIQNNGPTFHLLHLRDSFLPFLSPVSSEISSQPWKWEEQLASVEALEKREPLHIESGWSNVY